MPKNSVHKSYEPKNQIFRKKQIGYREAAKEKCIHNLATPRYSVKVHKCYEKNLWQSVALADSNSHQEQIWLVLEKKNHTLTKMVQKLL